MKNTFATEINKIKNQNEQLEKKLADQVEISKKDYQMAKDIMLKEFKSVEEKHGQYLTAVATLGDEFRKNMIETNWHYTEMEKCQTETDQCLCAMMEILSTIHQSLATGERPNAHTQDQINNFLSPRNGAPSSSNTAECSSTDLQGGGRSTIVRCQLKIFL
jgi:protein subunit release factor A